MYTLSRDIDKAVKLTPGIYKRGRLSNSLLYAQYPFTGNADNAIAGSVFGNGSVSGAALANDRFGNANSAYSFDGTDDYIELNDGDPTGLYTNGFTISAWIKPATVGENNTGRIIDKSTGGTNGNSGFMFFCRPTNTVACLINAGTIVTSATGSVVFGDGNRYHVVVVISSAGVCTFYVNGVISGTPASSGALSGITTTAKSRIGQRAGATDRTFNGSIDDVKIFKRPLSDVEVRNLYNTR